MSQERLNKCPLCKSGIFLNHTEIKDFSVSQEKFILCKCTSCDLVFTNPRPDKDNISKYYLSEDYISHQNKATNFINLLYKFVRNITIKKKVSWLNQYTHEKGSLLDIGCGTGYFLSAAKKSGWKTLGIEPNKTARNITKDKNLKVKSHLDQLKEDEKFDAISLYHVIEHVHTLKRTGKKITTLLKENGTVFIAVPNINSYDAKKYGSFWAAYDLPRHLYHFNQSTMQTFANQIGLKIIAVEPLKFDSYYVSLLSEKYINPNKGFIPKMINSIINGYKSNSWAKHNNNNYSSLLFILKKI
ncbi:class I SAM-dependent methyltransferase [Aquiflexum sp. LQ15W]|uniref:class I SAM-dependent methyltransferase n=1 Tax=Cognataquiflexum nitidum TaxID=2922272 RepID=UPI001F1454C4|nr:class I SAM-dependent methyltransferase [Cognataquiflexum nitidum]MCH6199148.1 class I SAM-dependent methyltransferase [Cognataquiflexum nitidum]